MAELSISRKLFTISRIRLLVQTGFFLYTLYIGLRFTLFYQWAIGQSEHFVARPPGVEGFLPISGLLGLKTLVLTGRYDQIHPAGLTILLAALAIGLLFRKGFCGWICPVGFVSNLAERAGRRMRILRRLPARLAWPFHAVKYLLLAFFCYIIFWKMSLPQIEAFQRSPYNQAAEAKMLFFFLAPSTLVAAILLGLVAISFVVPNFWCRFLCPYGALLGLLALAGPMKIHRDAATCINCQRCERHCPGGIRIAKKTRVLANECVGCLECVGACPVPDCLTLRAGQRRSAPPLLLPAAVITLFLLFFLAALATGHWYSSVPPETLGKYYNSIGRMAHPSY
jgi:polyferredoxin